MQESEIACVPHCATGETLELVHSGSSAGELFEEQKDSPEDRAKPDFLDRKSTRLNSSHSS